MTEAGEQIRILCVDDERNILKALERVFLDDDYEIHTADSGAEGLQVLERGERFQVVISDYRMPVMNGVEFLKVVYDRWPETVRIVLSGYADAGAIVAAINDGHIYKFIPKPWNDDELRVTIQNCIERYMLQEHNRALTTRLAEANAVLEEKVLQRTAQLELRNRALEFSQALLASLPAGVAGIDEVGMVAYCNPKGAELLTAVCNDAIGADVSHCCCIEFTSLVEEVRRVGMVDQLCTFGESRQRVRGNTFTYAGSQAVVLIFQEP